jgi:hypothetical protein
VRAHVASQKNDHGRSYGRYGASQQRSCSKISIWEIVDVVRFSTFSTISAQSGRSAFGRSTDDVQEYGSPSGKNPSRKLSSAAFSSQIAIYNSRIMY